MTIITEIGTAPLPGLDKIDELFKQLKRCKTNIQRLNVLVKLEDQLRKLFGTEFNIEIRHVGVYSDNFIVIPELKQVGKLTNTKDIVKLGHIKKLNFVIGILLINEATPRELTSILLHEIGHVTAHISNSIALLYKVLTPINSIISIFSKIPILGIALFPILIITSRTLNWTSHFSEYDADKFAVKYGYGDELIKVIHRWEKHEKNQKIFSNRTFSEKLELCVDLLKDFFLGDTHPDYKSRVKSIAIEIKKNYLKEYKSKTLQRVLDSYKL